MKTIVVLDLAHHGTTMVAGCFELLGVPMVATQYDAQKWEDKEVVQAIRRGEQAFAELVARRNMLKLWGFKYPGAWLFADLLEKYLVNPAYFAIYKDPVSVSIRRTRRVSSGTLLNTVNQMEDSISGISASGLSCNWLSYHRAITEPRAFVEQLVELAGLKVVEGQLNAATEYIKPNVGYQGVGEYLT